MTVLATVAEQVYTPGRQTIPFSGIQAGETVVTVTMTRVLWSGTGTVVTGTIDWGGGDIAIARFPIASGDAKIGCGKPVGKTSGTVYLDVSQSCRSGISVDSI